MAKRHIFENASRPIVMRLTLPKGTRAIHVQSVTGSTSFKGEAEILLQRGSEVQGSPGWSTGLASHAICGQ
jgi:hypothetical protein